MNLIDEGSFWKQDVEVSNPNFSLNFNTKDCYVNKNIEVDIHVVDQNLKPENVRKDTTVLGVTGTLEESCVKNYTLTLNIDDWVGSSAPYTATKTVNGITQYDEPDCDCTASSTFSIAQQQLESYNYIYDLITDDNKVTFYATNKPTISLDIRLKVVM